MAEKSFPGPSYNRLIETDPQIVKVAMDIAEWGARMSVMPSGRDPQKPGEVHGAPAAPEMVIKHTS